MADRQPAHVAGLLLTQADFQHVYQPRDLYFLSQSGDTLVPDPVFVPQQATNTELATGLVNALLQDPTGWLSGAAVTGFPAHAQPIGQVRINGQNATVDLGGSTESPSPPTGSSLSRWPPSWPGRSPPGPRRSSPSSLSSTTARYRIMGNQYQLPQAYQGWVPSQAAGSSLYFLGSNGAVQALSGVGQPGAGQRASAFHGAAGAAGASRRSPRSPISPNGRSVAGIAAGGAAVYFGALSRGAALREWRPTSGSCTSVSWDERGDLWITAGGIVWMLPPDGSSARLVTVAVPPEADVTDFLVAPDGVRVVMIVRGASTQPAWRSAPITHSGQAASVAGQPVTIGAGHPRARRGDLVRDGRRHRPGRQLVQRAAL